LYECRLATLADVAGITRINLQWLLQQPPEQPSQMGFLYGDPLVASDLHAIVGAGEATVALSGGAVVGYYLLDNHSDTYIRDVHLTLLDACQRSGLVAATARVSSRMQCAISREHHMRGLSRRMFGRLIEAIDGNYDLLFATVSEKNEKLGAHQRLGWRVVETFKGIHAIVFEI
jgi:hypothetical protein